VDDKAASAYLGIFPRSLWGMGHPGQIPFCKCNRTLRYDLNDLDAFIEKSKQNRGGELSAPSVDGLKMIGELAAEMLQRQGIEPGGEP